MTSEKGCRKDKNQNIQVFVRLRPLNQRERDIKSLGVIEVLNNREVIVRQSQTSHTKKFTFDRAFGPNAKQVEIYQDVVSPLIEEVLNGYNCTVFAYGQTGTGKTHTMVGENTSDDTNWQNGPLAGIIPRALSQLFDELRISNTEHTVRVSYLELYNEELFDLLSSSEDNSKLRIYEDVTRKGSNIVNGLEEIAVSNKNEVYKIMSQGQERKKVASTLMNAQSSRSHTVFTIVVHMKENSPEGEELVKIGKLNLVDLAGSENISKAGSDNPAKKERARECVNINQSLLTLGRVITALVEKHPHIPYRESKLTRILQESLGGRTKTSIIATISPGHKDLEETMSTLEYANRAKNIQNKPEVNQKMTKKAILRQYVEEIDRLKKDLQAARDKNGVFLSNDTYTELTLRQEEQKKEIQELLLKKRAMEEEKDKLETVFSDLNCTLEQRAAELRATREKLAGARTQLVNTSNLLRSSRIESSERAHLVAVQQSTEQQLSSQARALLAAADVAAAHAASLHDTVDRRRTVESCNLQVTRGYRAQAAAGRAQLAAAHAELAAAVTGHVRAMDQHVGDAVTGHVRAMDQHVENITSSSDDALQSNKNVLEQIVQCITDMMNELRCSSEESERSLSSATERHAAAAREAVARRRAALAAAVEQLTAAAAAAAAAARARDLPAALAGHVHGWYTQARERVESLQRAHAQFRSSLATRETARADTARERDDARLAAVDARVKDIQQAIQMLEEERSSTLSRLESTGAALEEERRVAEQRLQAWLEEETRAFQRRLAEHVRVETAALEHRLSAKTRELEEERASVEARVSRHLACYRALLSAADDDAREQRESARVRDEAARETETVVDGYSKEFDDGSAAITCEMEALSSNVVEAAQQLYSSLLDALSQANEQLQLDTQSAVTEESAAAEQLESQAEAARRQLLLDHRQALHHVLDKLQANNTSTLSSLSTISSTSSSLSASIHQLSSSHASTARAASCLVATFEQQLQAAVEDQARLEDKYLAEEYKVYTPTGGTPQRTEYRYPRALAATSPHERILARYRAARRPSVDDEDCILVESEPESRAASDAESSLSEDSVFLTPAPRAPARGELGIVKCTSESDIYTIKRNQDQGKENAEQVTNGYKKPSKLRAPASHKKPLVERNGPN